MRLAFWRSGGEPVEVGACKHDFTNWSDPAPSTRLAFSSPFASEGREVECQEQRRHCLKCNLHERRFL
jgi:hypothetical protein